MHVESIGIYKKLLTMVVWEDNWLIDRLKAV